MGKFNSEGEKSLKTWASVINLPERRKQKRKKREPASK